MQIFDVAIVGGGPAGSTCAALCAAAGLRTIVLEREMFPREKVCGDCLNPACWPILREIGCASRVRSLPHGNLATVEFIAIDGARVSIDLPVGEDAEIAVKRSSFDSLLMENARAAGADVRDGTIVIALEKQRGRDWRIDLVKDKIMARILVAADGRNSTVARLRNLLPRLRRERIALQTHIALPRDFGDRVVLQFLPDGYTGQAPVNDDELNLCLVASPPRIGRLKDWATKEFTISPAHPWRTVTPLTRAPIAPAQENLLLIGDAARVVEPFTGEGIYYALRSAKLAATAVVKMLTGNDPAAARQCFAQEHAEMYHGRLWINRLARQAVLSPHIASLLVHLAKMQPGILKLLTGKLVNSSKM
ncbi:MAG: hypothetical protein QOH39_934 [Verrucomicrobiota bacterium]|jgi:geranylgeranyl reductase family protein